MAPGVADRALPPRESAGRASGGKAVPQATIVAAAVPGSGGRTRSKSMTMSDLKTQLLTESKPVPPSQFTVFFFAIGLPFAAMFVLYIGPWLQWAMRFLPF